MKFKLTQFDATYIPDIKYKDSEGNIIKNRENDPEDQIICEITMASQAQKGKYITFLSYNDSKDEEKTINKTVFNYNSCIEAHVKKVMGLEEFNINDGKSLIVHVPTPELNDLINDLFLKICGIKVEDILTSKK
jgi:hypothetical protein